MVVAWLARKRFWSALNGLFLPSLHKRDYKTLHRVIAKQPYIKLWLTSYMTRGIDKRYPSVMPDWKPVKFVSIQWSASILE